jgi:hypothetical protein
MSDQLDYFGSLVNMAGQLERLSSSEDVILSDSTPHDPEVAEFITDNGLVLQRFASQLRGFEEKRLDLWRVGRASTEVPGRTEKSTIRLGRHQRSEARAVQATASSTLMAGSSAKNVSGSRGKVTWHSLSGLCRLAISSAPSMLSACTITLKDALLLFTSTEMRTTSLHLPSCGDQAYTSGLLRSGSTVRHFKPFLLQFDNRSINNRPQFSCAKSGDL